MPYRPIIRRALAAAATFAAGAALLGALSPAVAEQRAPEPSQAPPVAAKQSASAAAALDAPNAPNAPPPEAPKPKPSPARKYLPVKHFGGY